MFAHTIHKRTQTSRMCFFLSFNYPFFSKECVLLTFQKNRTVRKNIKAMQRQADQFEFESLVQERNLTAAREASARLKELHELQKKQQDELNNLYTFIYNHNSEDELADKMSEANL
jgi:hypothetical protein